MLTAFLFNGPDPAAAPMSVIETPPVSKRPTAIGKRCVSSTSRSHSTRNLTTKTPPSTTLSRSESVDDTMMLVTDKVGKKRDGTSRHPNAVVRNNCSLKREGSSRGVTRTSSGSGVLHTSSGRGVTRTSSGRGVARTGSGRGVARTSSGRSARVLKREGSNPSLATSSISTSTSNTNSQHSSFSDLAMGMGAGVIMAGLESIGVHETGPSMQDHLADMEAFCQLLKKSDKESREKILLDAMLAKAENGGRSSKSKKRHGK